MVMSSPLDLTVHLVGQQLTHQLLAISLSLSLSLFLSRPRARTAADNSIGQHRPTTTLPCFAHCIPRSHLNYNLIGDNKSKVIDQIRAVTWGSIAAHSLFHLQVRLSLSLSLSCTQCSLLMSIRYRLDNACLPSFTSTEMIHR